MALFVQAMLCKVDLSEILKEQNFNNYSLRQNFQDYYTTNTTYTTIKYKFTNAYIIYNGSGATVDNCKFLVKVLDGTSTQKAYNDYKILNTPTNFEKEITGTPNFKFQFASGFDFCNLYGNLKITAGYTNTPDVKGLPRAIKEIGNKAGITIFGVHIDNSRVTQD